MRLIYLFSAFILFTCSLKGQQYFNNLYGKPNPFIEYPPLIAQSIDSSYIMCYGDEDLSQNNGTYIITRLDKYGDTLFTKKYSKPDCIILPYSMRPTFDGNFVSAGIFQDNAALKTNFHLLKFNSLGDTLWTQHYSTTDVECVPFALIQTSDSGFALAGYTVDYDTVNNQYLDGQVFVVKTDSIGNLQWQQAFGDTTTDDNAYGIIETIDRNFLLAGRSIRYNPFDFQGYLVKIDSLGNLIWHHTHGTSNWFEAYTGITSSNDGNYIITSGINKCPPVGWCGSAWLLKVTPEDSLLWDYEYMDGIKANGFNNAVILNNGDIVIAGSTETPNGKQTGLVFKTNSQGDSLWSHIYDKNPNYGEYLNNIITTLDGGFVCMGVAVNSATTNSDAWLIKLDSLGCDSFNCQFTTLPEHAFQFQSMMKLYPNPASNQVKISLSSFDANVKQQILIYNAIGKLIIVKEVFNLDNTISLSNFSPGMYYCTLDVNGIKVDAQKLVVLYR